MKKMRRFFSLAVVLVLLFGWAEPIALWAAEPKEILISDSSVVDTQKSSSAPYSIPPNTSAALGQPV